MATARGKIRAAEAAGDAGRTQREHGEDRAHGSDRTDWTERAFGAAATRGCHAVVLEASRTQATAASPLVTALVPIAGSGTLEIVHELDTCLDRCRRGDVDLVVVDEGAGRDAEEAVGRLRRAGPPTVVVQRRQSDGAALAWYRRGAAECVAAERDYGALRHAVREQLERLRALRGAGPREREAVGPDGIIEHLNSALVVVDPDGRIAFANPPAEQLLGESQEALLGRAISDWYAPDAEPLLTRTLEKGDRYRGAETRWVRSDGQVLPVGISCAPIAGADGRPSGAVAIFHDLSEAQEWRAHVLQTEKMASIGQLAAGVAHEINNPMGFIHANLFQMSEYVAELRQVWSRTEALQKALGTGEHGALERAAEELLDAAQDADVAFLLADLAKAVRESQEGSERIRHIVQDLRDFSHHDTGERVLADLNQCLDSTANIVWPMMKHLVVLEKDYRELPPVPCYPMQLKQVFMNLLVNAYQAIEALPGAREAGATGTITLRTTPREDGVQIEVRDTGIGIASQHLDRIFDPFFTTKKVGAGTGLGLSTSFNIIKRHGGTLGVESERGRGTLFRIRLPLLEETIGASSSA